MKKTLILGLFLLAGCQSESVRIPEPIAPATSADGTAVLILMVKENAKFGEDGFNFIDNEKILLSSMKISRNLKFEVPSGSHKFAVSSWGSPASELQAELQPGTQTCIEVRSNGANYYGKFVFPLMRNAVPTHLAQFVSCAIEPAPDA